eukprot:ANDGO_06953.mRNA.1 Arginyl-tRNA--protein transferase 1
MEELRVVRKSQPRLVVPKNPDMGYPCGYCGQENTSVTFSSLSCTCGPDPSLTVSDYQSVIDRGWRRSGGYLYIKDNEKSCCPHYPIRLDVHRFRPSHSQKRVIRRFQSARFGPLCDIPDLHRHANSDHEQDKQRSEKKRKSWACIVSDVLGKSEAVAALQRALALELKNADVDSSKSMNQSKNEVSLFRLMPSKLIHRGQIMSNAPLAFDLDADKAMRIADALVAQCAHAGVLDVQYALPGFLNVRLAGNVWTDLQAAIEKEHLEVLKCDSSRQQKKAPVGSETVAESTLQEPLMHTLGRTSANSFTVQILPSEFSDEKYALYKKYQMAVHKDAEKDLSEDRFANFLCDSPLFNEPMPLNSARMSSVSDGRANPANAITEFGSYHMEYRWNGMLISVGVVDILPACVSSVYCFYDPAWHDAALGVVSAMCEIQLALDLALPYFYLGYYIHGCPKMQYKAGYSPSDLLCPVTLHWVPAELWRDQICANKFCRLDKGHEEDAASRQKPISRTEILSQRVLVHLPRAVETWTVANVLSAVSKPAGEKIVAAIQRYMQAVGPELCKEMDLVFQ